jgi:cytochrome c
MVFKSMLAGIAVAVMAAGPVLAADCQLPAEAQPGKAISSQCKACHTFDASKPKGPVGPNLHDVYGEKAGTQKEFKYSEAIQAANAKGLEWTDDKLVQYLADPKAFLTSVNGSELKNLMAFNLKDEGKRKDIVAFLKAIKGKPECN